MSPTMISMARSQQLTLCNLLALIRNPQLCGPPTLNTCKNIFATIDVAEDQNKESSPTEPPRKSSIPNSAKISVVFIPVGFVVAIFLFFLHFKKARKLKKKGRKVEERKEEQQP